MDNFKVRVMALQSELKAPKGQTNKFGGYKYRSCEDILEAVKPLLKKYSMVLTIGDDLINYGDRYYICATATLRDTESGEGDQEQRLRSGGTGKEGHGRGADHGHRLQLCQKVRAEWPVLH